MDLTSHSQAPTQFIFPILKHSDILQCMSELEIELSKNELAEPIRHKDRVRKVFAKLLEVCCGLTEDDFTPTPQAVAQASQFPYPQVHEDLSDLKFYIRLRKCMETCGLHDFGWKDLYAPTAKRFRCQLSAIINLAKFREEHLRFYSELNSERVLLSEALSEVYEENALKTAALEEAKQESSTKFQEMHDLERDCEELEVEIARHNKIQANMREESTQLKKQANDLKDELATAELALQEAEQEKAQLTAKIVSSPDRRKRDLQEKTDLLERERQEIKILEDKLQKNKTKILHVTQAIQDVPETTAAVEEVLETVNKAAHVKSQIASTQSQQDVIRKKTADVEFDMEESEGALHRAEEKLAHSRKQHKVKMDAAGESLELVQQQMLAVEKDHRDGMARVDQGEMEVQALEQQIEEERQRTQEEIAIIMHDYRMMEKSLLEENNKLLMAIGAK